jgi:hypothetical protein
MNFDRSETLSKLAPALLKAQQTIEAAEKNAKNPHFGNAFANVSSVIEAVKEPLNAAGITFIQFGCPAPEGQLGLTTILLHSSGEYLAGTITLPLPKADPQGTGSAMTYARRYCLQAAVGLVTEDDDANAAVTHDAKPAKKGLFPTR